MNYLIPNGETFTIYYDKTFIPADQLKSVIEVEVLPSGSGILKRDIEGVFYIEPYPEPEPQPVPPEPEPVVDQGAIQLQILINTEMILLNAELSGI